MYISVSMDLLALLATSSNMLMWQGLCVWQSVSVWQGVSLLSFGNIFPQRMGNVLSNKLTHAFPIPGSCWGLLCRVGFYQCGSVTLLPLQ